MRFALLFGLHTRRVFLHAPAVLDAVCADRRWRAVVTPGNCVYALAVSVLGTVIHDDNCGGGDMGTANGALLLGAAVFLLLAAAVLMLVMVAQLRAMRHEVEATRLQLAKMDWGVMLLNGVQQLKQATTALEQIDKRLQKLEALEKVQISHINTRHLV